ncbi:hypothetical protein [Halorhabdus sp. SVX81]|uniref:hypothetical protein n=1 Tax=Halorhabdus sp. SVX81 TaxID=2978283 RepID=UPI0023DC49F9|nr:hypothetical protein [Halorhabdus sp. SVX81]
MVEAVLTLPVVGLGVEAFLVLLIAALAGGAFGAALGAVPAFVFTGFVVFLGEGLAILEGNLGDLTAIEGDIATGVTGTIGFGMVTGPHVAFAGGVAATAYAGRYHPEMASGDWAYHPGKNILYAFGTKPDILAVGAVFGALGMVITQVGNGLGLPTDNIALSVVATAVIARIAFDYPIVGRVAGANVLDMSPFERGEERPAETGEPTRPATEPWLPHQYEWAGVTAIGLVAGIVSGYIWLETGSVFMGYAVSAMSLLFLNLGVEKIPVTHHITLIGSVGAILAMATVDSEPLVLLVAGGFGILAALLGEVTQRVFYAHSGTHLDPPAMAIAIVMTLVGILYLAGLLPNAGYLGL